MNPSKQSGLALKVGRPRSYMPDEIEREIQAYFQHCLDYTEEQATPKGEIVNINKPRIPTMGGLMNWLGIDRATWKDYGEQSEYSNIIKNTNTKITEAKEDALVNGQGSTTGLIFYLKAKEGWVDRQTIQHEGDINITLNLD